MDFVEAAGTAFVAAVEDFGHLIDQHQLQLRSQKLILVLEVLLMDNLEEIEDC